MVTRPRRSSISSPRAARAAISGLPSTGACGMRSGSRAVMSARWWYRVRASTAFAPADADDDAIAEIFQRAPHARFPVYQDSLDHIIGVVHVKDLLRS